MMLRILIVEDEEHLARLLAEVLGREGHAAETASDGRSGLTRALVEPFDSSRTSVAQSCVSKGQLLQPQAR
jgi:CheY-like chemotaxis protein